MAMELFPENSYLEGLSGLTDPITGVYYPVKGEGLDWYVSFVKCIYRLVRNLYVCSGLRVYKVSNLSFCVKGGIFFDENELREYNDLEEYELEDNATNYIYMLPDGTVEVSTEGFPQPEEVRHIRLAIITTSNGGYTDDDIIDCRALSIWKVAGPTGNIKDGAINKDKLAAPVAGFLPEIELTVGEENLDTIRVDIQVKDIQENNLAGRFLLRVWLSDVAYGGECAAAPTAGVSWPVGEVLEEQTVGKRWLVITDENGAAAVDITESGVASFYLNVELDGRIYVSELISFS